MASTDRNEADEAGLADLDQDSYEGCRMYENKYPEVDELVVVQVKSIAEMGAYVSLLEYNGIEGMIPMNELSNRRIRSVGKLIRVGRTEIAVVLRVDKEKGYIDLSKRRVAPEEIAKCDQRWNKSKAVHSIMTRVAKMVNMPLLQLQENITWPLYRKYGHAHDAFKLFITEPEQCPELAEMPENIREALLQNVRRRLTPQAVKIRAEIELTCFQYEGIDAIKAALNTARGFSTEQQPIQIHLIAPPQYVITTTTLDKERGIQTLTEACEAIANVIREKGGDMNLKTPPRAITERDEKSLATMLEDLAKQAQDDLEAEFD
eukprot:TRINITY_DN3269_c0_g1_i1.p1 TRINITY_DN3269_c0_g1~~TRINITY_DN3269_c0_g1_i1.p1  ORF type:complete len:319 (+),score=101.60 TRINITY_DN3269_c0_g1_i1:104-1060(+)